MILEQAILQIKPGETADFENSFREASAIISRMPGYIRHSLHRCMEDDHRYVLHVEWETLEDHTVGFRGSEDYLTWKKLLHHYYDPFPIVEHYQEIDLGLRRNS